MNVTVFSTSVNRGWFSTNVKWNRKFPQFPIFRKNGNLERLTNFFEMNVPEKTVALDSRPNFSEILTK